MLTEQRIVSAGWDQRTRAWPTTVAVLVLLAAGSRL